MRWPALLALPLGLALATAITITSGACSYDWTYTNDRNDASKEKDGGNGGDDAGDEASPPIGACTWKQKCADGKICAYADNQCGRVSPKSSCIDPPATCDSTGKQVCTCDGQFVDPCVALKEQRTFDDTGASCEAKTFDCSSEKCTVGADYCHYKGGVGACVPYPASCSHDCKCSALPACECTTDASGNVFIKCA